MAKKLPALCPCGSGRTLAACCGRFINEGMIPPSAVALMRSRYSEIGRAVKWIGLTVKNETQIDATHATVEYIARGRAGSTGAFRLHAVSRFEKREGRWFYVDDKEHSQS